MNDNDYENDDDSDDNDRDDDNDDYTVSARTFSSSSESPSRSSVMSPLTATTRLKAWIIMIMAIIWLFVMFKMIKDDGVPAHGNHSVQSTLLRAPVLKAFMLLLVAPVMSN